MSDHPQDDVGRVLPDPSWPDDRAAPGRLELVRRFCNTINRENGADRFAEPDGLRQWLHAEALPPWSVTDLALDRVTAFRERLHGLIRTHGTGEPAEGDLDDMTDLLAPVRLAVVAGPAGVQLVVHTSHGADHLLGLLALAVIDAQYRNTWPRLKTCVHCHWVVYDSSKNRSARWCSMTACGGREHARTYRKRRSG